MFWHFYQNPKSGEVYNAGGGRFANCSMKEAVSICEGIAGKKMNISYSENNRSGDHIWYISDLTKFKQHYPNWNWQYGLEDTLVQIYDSLSKRV
jgi:CDP-paratose 2-epimerase